MHKKFMATVVAAMLLASAASAQTTKPTIKKFSFTDNSLVEVMSNNGQWALVQAGYEEDRESGKARIINLDTQEETLLQTTDDVANNGVCGAADVTDDGTVVVGSYKGSPAYWNKDTGKWTTLDGDGWLSSVTADGKYAVGTVSISGEYKTRGALYDLTTGKEVELSNIPSKDMLHRDMQQQSFTQISADGRYIAARMSFSYIGGGAEGPQCCAYIYDVQEQKATFVGFTPSDTADWTPLDEGLYFIDEIYMSNNGRWVTGLAYSTSDEYTAFLYDVENDEFTLFNQSTDIGTVGYNVCDDGTVLGASPVNTPLREWYVRRGNYWVAVSDIFAQRYGMDFYTTTLYERTGYTTAVSSDGKTILATEDPTSDSYMVKFPESIGEACTNVNLLGTYTVSPVEGTSFARMRTVKLTFTRNLALVGNYLNVALKDEDGTVVSNPVSGGGVSVNGKVLTLSFRAAKSIMEAGKKYYIEIDAGTVAMKEDNSVRNEKITLEYQGRDNVPVAYTSIYPANNSEVTSLDYTSNPILIAFDTYITKTDTASARLVNKTDGSTVCELSMATSANMLGVYPSAKQYLYLGTDYQVVIDGGSVADLQGYGGNEEIVIDYTGVYEREISSDDATLFFDDFSNTSQSYVNFMRYEGDHNTPTSDMQAWTFDADNMPWNFTIRESASSDDNCAASTSMYSPAGKSDDWMVIPQLNIPDEFCTLSFLAQSYKLNKKDSLKVLIYTSDENINVLTAATIEKMRTQGDLVFSQLLSPGETEEGLSGEWTKYTVDLAKYSGKNIYIAFLNDNEDQSCVFVDSVSVVRNLKYLLSLSNAASVVNQDKLDIAGTLTANSDFDTFTSVSLALCASDGTQVGETIEQSGLALKKGDKFAFAFTTPLPLERGIVNKFSIKVRLDNYSDTKKSTVKNLTFEPTKNVVLEEMTGTTCPNCPYGILAIENLREVFGTNIIPVSIHTYSGDDMGTGLSGYSTALGLTAAPTGVVNRNGYISSPIWQNPVTAAYSFTNLKDHNSWFDYVTEEMNTPADAELSIGDVTIDETANTFTLPASVRYALSANNLSLNIFVTVLEDGIVSNQENNLYGSSDPLFGDWGKGGKYGASNNYNITHNDVCRAYYSTSIEGTNGYLPQSLTADEPYEFSFTGQIPAAVSVQDNAKAVMMLLDANTGKVINAAVAYFNPETTGVKTLSGNAANAVTVRTNGGNITVLTGADATISIYTTAGTQIASSKSVGAATLSTNGYRGMAIVKVTTGSGTTVKKVLVR